MTVFRLIFRDGFPLQRYEIEGHVVIRCITYEDAAIGEILLTTIAQGYTVNGGGFCHHPAGENVVSANDIEHLRWKLFKAVTMEDASFARHMEKEIALISRLEVSLPRNTISEYIAAQDEINTAKISMELLSQRATTAVRIAAVRNCCCQELLLP